MFYLSIYFKKWLKRLSFSNACIKTICEYYWICVSCRAVETNSVINQNPICLLLSKYSTLLLKRHDQCSFYGYRLLTFPTFAITIFKKWPYNGYNHSCAIIFTESLGSQINRVKDIIWFLWCGCSGQPGSWDWMTAGNSANRKMTVIV